MRKQVLIILGSIFLSFSLVAQQTADKMKFESEVYDFKEVKEEDGPITHVFEFENTAEVPVIIESVKASCGCTTPAWTKEPVLPGEVGFIKATYNPARRPGKFNKSITVASNFGNKVLRIKGSVIPRPLTRAEKYPKKMGGLRLKTHYVSFLNIRNTETSTFPIEVINDSEENVKVEFGEMPDYIKVSIDKTKLKPEEKGTITVDYDAERANVWGFRSDLIPVFVNEEEKSTNTLIVTATIIEDFTNLSEEEKAQAPKVGVSEKNYNFEEIKSGELVEKEFKITNLGKTDLLIRKIETTCECLEAKIDFERIKPSTQAVLTAKFNTSQRRGLQNQYITLITNDPDLPVVKLRVSGVVM